MGWSRLPRMASLFWGRRRRCGDSGRRAASAHMAFRARGGWARCWRNGSFRASRNSICGIWISAASGPIRPAARILPRACMRSTARITISVIPSKSAAARASCASARSTIACANWARSSAKNPAGSVPTGSPRMSHWPIPQGWAARFWSPAIGAEHQATRERVALFDETSFSKLEVAGPGALAFLQYITDNQMDQPIGTITYTQMLNRRGGIECDLTVTRLAADRFQIITGTAFGIHDLAWIRSHAPTDGSVIVRDVTSSRCCIGVWGPRARDLVQSVSENDFSNTAFPYLTAQEVTIGDIPALALRVTYVGELGWEIYAPMEYGQKLWDTLWEAGRPLGVVAAGYRAIESLRLEKGYRYWSADIHSEYNPYEAGLGFAVKPGKGDFLGREALAEIKARGITRKLCCLVLDDPRAIALGGEPLLDGARVLGHVTSGGYGYTVRQSIAYGYLPLEYSAVGTRIEVELFGVRSGATVAREPLYDPKNEKIKA